MRWRPTPSRTIAERRSFMTRLIGDGRSSPEMIRVGEAHSPTATNVTCGSFATARQIRRPAQHLWADDGDIGRFVGCARKSCLDCTTKPGADWVSVNEKLLLPPPPLRLPLHVDLRPRLDAPQVPGPLPGAGGDLAAAGRGDLALVE